MEKEKIYSYFFLALILFFLFSAFTTLMPFLTPILWAVVLSIVLYPVNSYIEKKTGNRTISAFLLTLTVLLFLILPLSFISVLLVNQVAEATQRVVSHMQEHSYRELLNNLKNLPLLKPHAERLDSFLEFAGREDIKEVIANSLNNILKFIGDKVGKLFLMAGKNLFYVFVFLITFFFLLRDGSGILKRAVRLVPMDDEDLEDLLKTIYRTTLAVVYGSVGTALIQAVLAFIAYSIVGINFALLWSVMTFFSAFIPPFGASLIWFPLALFTLLTVSLWKGIFMMLWGLFLISTMDNFVRPLIIKQGVQIPYVILFFATIGGLLKFGFLGLFLGPIIFTTLFTLLSIYDKKILKKGS